MSNNVEKKNEQEIPVCLVIMPFTDPKGYEQGHFRKVYDQILAPAIRAAGYDPHRIDDEIESTLIHGKLLDQLINAPMVLCDLSSKNPNVLYELGIRHAFDKPVVLVQEKGQDRIFDIAGLTTSEYRKERLYDEVIEDQGNIEKAIRQTATAKKHSIMSLVRLSPAKLNQKSDLSSEEHLEIMLVDMSRRLSRIEDKVSNEKSPESTWRTRYYNEITESAERRLQMIKMDASSVLMRARHKDYVISRGDLQKITRELESAIIDCQSARTEKTAQVASAKALLADLRLLLESKEQLATIG